MKGRLFLLELMSIRRIWSKCTKRDREPTLQLQSLLRRKSNQRSRRLRWLSQVRRILSFLSLKVLKKLRSKNLMIRLRLHLNKNQSKRKSLKSLNSPLRRNQKLLLPKKSRMSLKPRKKSHSQMTNQMILQNPRKKQSRAQRMKSLRISLQKMIPQNLKKNNLPNLIKPKISLKNHNPIPSLKYLSRKNNSRPLSTSPR